MNFTEKSIKNGKFTFKLAWERALRFKAIPKWARTPRHKKAILSIYIQAQLKNLETKKRWQVDHIDPLYGINVCGLHVAENLRVISKNANQAKSNYFRPYILSRDGKKTFLEGVLPLPEKVSWKPPRKGRANPTKKSFKRRAKRLIFRKRNFYK
jgi:hypothetical protein